MERLGLDLSLLFQTIHHILIAPSDLVRQTLPTTVTFRCVSSILEII
jgi:hypothetical protein